LTDKKNVLICPLNWGLGHASRCVPVVRAFIAAGAHVIIAADHRPLAFLHKEFPELQCVTFPAYEVTYQRKGSFILKFLKSIPLIVISIYREHKQLKCIIDDYNIDIVFSDNRFGLWNNKVKSIFMTHQLSVKSPFQLFFIDKLLFLLNKTFIKNYDECWIPDFKGEINLSGDLAHKYKLPINTYFIGALSRFENTNPYPVNNSIDLLVLLSGPEPQRTIFEEIILKQLEKKTLKTIIVQGIPEKNEIKIINKNLSIYSHLETEKLEAFIQQSQMILCRSGYSTIMDLVVFGKKAILVPTPGQTEQEYLATLYMNKKYYYSVSQKHFKLDEALIHSASYSGIHLNKDGELLKERVEMLLNPT